MAYVFNPFTGNFDVVDTNTAAGSDTQVQFNDGGTLAGDTALTWNKTSDQLTVGGDINLDSGGNFSTTIQSVTPTANRTISFPDQTGTVGLVSGATGNIQYNSSGALAGSAKLSTELDWTSAAGTYTGLKVNVDNGAGGAPLGSGNLLDLQVGGSSRSYVENDGSFHFGGNSTHIGRLEVLSSVGIGLYEPSGFGQILLGNDNAAFINLNGRIIFGTNLSSNRAFLFGANDLIEQRSGTNAQTYRLYNTYTDASNYERLSFNWDTNVFKIKSEAVGTGTVRGIQLGSTSTEPVALFGATPVAQPTTAVGSATVAGGGGTAVDDATTFGGYTLAQVVQALQNLGILA